jgi:hypothetical protein
VFGLVAEKQLLARLLLLVLLSAQLLLAAALAVLLARLRMLLLKQLCALLSAEAKAGSVAVCSVRSSAALPGNCCAACDCLLLLLP